MNRNTITLHSQPKPFINSQDVITRPTFVQKPSVIPYLNNSLQGFKRTMDGVKSIGKTQVPPPPPYVIANHSKINFTNVYRNQPQKPQPPPFITQQFPRQNSTVPPTIYINHPQSPPTQLPHPTQHRPLAQTASMKQTMIPIHCYNQFPQQIIANIPDSAQNDQAYQLLLREYQKTYQELIKKRQSSFELQKIKQDLQAVKKTNISVNLQQLAGSLKIIYRNSIEQILLAKQITTKKRFSNMFLDAKKQLLITKL